MILASMDPCIAFTVVVLLLFAFSVARGGRGHGHRGHRGRHHWAGRRR